MNGLDQFRDFAAQRGYELPQRIEPGRRFRFSTNGKRGDAAGWGVLFADGLGGVIGDWRTGQTDTWQAKRGARLSDTELKEWRERIEREKREAQAERERIEAEAAAQAAQIWESCAAAPADHPYLKAKAVQPHGLRLYSGTQSIGGMECDGALVMPFRNTDGAIRSLEFISATGEKRFLPGGSYRACYFAIGKPADEIAICEGFATGATIHASTGHAVRIAGTAGNLEDVAKAIRAKAPRARLILCADNDRQTVCVRHKAEGVTVAIDPLTQRPEWCRCNPGVTAALSAARAVGGSLAIPTPAEGTDCNDLAKEKGKEAVRAAIDGASHSAALAVSTSTPKGSDWPTPEKLPELPAVPAFDFDFLPAQLRAFVQDISERMQCPPEFAAVGAVAMAGAAIGRNLAVRPKLEDSWSVVPNLWGMLVGKSGLMKSPALGEALKPLERMQALAFEQYEQDRRDFAITEKAEKIRAADAEAKARKALAQDQSANLSAILRPDAQLIEPKLRRYIVNDSSPEALCETLEDNPQGVLCVRDELIGLLRSMDKEGNQEARALYLTAADGDKSFTVDRIGRGKGRHIPALCVSIIGGIQPGVLASYVRETQRSGAGDDGLLQRFALMVYPDVTAEWRNVDRKPNAEARDSARQLIERLTALTAEAVGAELDNYGGIPFLRFDGEAYGLFIAWLAELEKKLRAGDDHPAITSHLSKFRKLVPALALINHLCEGGSGAISKKALARALFFSEFLEAHARRVYSYAARPDLDAAKTILAKLRGGKLPREFTARHVYRAGWSGLTTPEETGAALRVLCEYGYLQELRDQETGGRTATMYLAHPNLAQS